VCEFSKNEKKPQKIKLDVSSVIQQRFLLFTYVVGFEFNIIEDIFSTTKMARIMIFDNRYIFYKWRTKY